MSACRKIDLRSEYLTLLTLSILCKLDTECDMLGDVLRHKLVELKLPRHDRDCLRTTAVAWLGEYGLGPEMFAPTKRAWNKLRAGDTISNPELALALKVAAIVEGCLRYLDIQSSSRYYSMYWRFFMLERYRIEQYVRARGRQDLLILEAQALTKGLIHQGPASL